MLALIASVGSLSGCGPESAHEAPTAVVAQPLAASITLTLPSGATQLNTAIGASGAFLHVNDGAIVESTSPRIPGVRVLPVIAGNGIVEVGVAASVGAVISRGTARFRGGSAGSTTTATTVQAQSGSFPGNVQEGAELGDSVIRFDLDLPTDNLGPRSTTPGGPALDLPPAGYGRVIVSSRSELHLHAGTYSFEELIVEPQGSLVLANGPGPVHIHIRSGFTYRGRIIETHPERPNVLFAYDGTASVPIESAFRGTFVAPNASVMISGNSATHVGAFFGRRVELHQRHRLQHRPYRAGAEPACSVATITEIQDFPFDRSRDIDNDLQGVTHSDDTWYFSNAKSTLCGIGTSLCNFSHIWSYHITENINDNPGTLWQNPWGPIPSGISSTQYAHFGDITYVPGQADGSGLVLVALEAGRQGTASRGAIGALSENLEFHFGFGVLPVPEPAAADQGGSMPWVSFNRHGDQLLYSAAFDSTWLNAYSITLRPEISPSGAGLDVAHERSIRFRDCRTNAPVAIQRMQGAGFSETGKLYISIDVQGGGVIAVDPSDGRVLQFARVNFDRQGENEELEGVTIWDLDDGSSTGVSGHIHVQMIQNEDLSNDDFYFKHLRADDYGKL